MSFSNKLIVSKIKSLVADKETIAARAQNESKNGEWSRDWLIYLREIDSEIANLENSFDYSDVLVEQLLFEIGRLQKQIIELKKIRVENSTNSKEDIQHGVPFDEELSDN